jgi:hypothetical protein
LRRLWQWKRLKKSTAVWSAIVYLSGVVLSGPAEASLWGDRRRSAESPKNLQHTPSFATNSSALALPSLSTASSSPVVSSDASSNLPAVALRHVTVKKAISGRNGHVILVEDVHEHSEAQSQIGRFLVSLVGDEETLVGIEAAHGFLNFAPYHALPRPDVLRSVAERFLSTGKLLGSTFAALSTQPRSLRIIGVESPSLYRRNVKAYLETQALRRTAEEDLGRLLAFVESANPLTSPVLRAFEERCDQYADGKRTLADHVRFLMEGYPHAAAPLPLAAFYGALRLEKQLDFVRVKTEQSAVVNALASRATGRALDDLMEASRAVSGGRASRLQFYDRLAICLDRNDV